MVAEETSTLMLPAPPALLALPEICTTAVEQAKEALLQAGKKIIKAFNELARMIAETLRPAVEKAIRAIHRIFDATCRALVPKKWWHIYKHTKSCRIRKKYEKRIRERVFAILNEDWKE